MNLPTLSNYIKIFYITLSYFVVYNYSILTCYLFVLSLSASDVKLFFVTFSHFLLTSHMLTSG